MNIKTKYLLKYILYTVLLNHRKSRTYKQKIRMFQDNKIVFTDKGSRHIKLNISGKNNQIIIKNTVRAKLNISVFGDNNIITIDDYVWAGRLDVVIGQNHKNFGPVHDCEVRVGEGSSFESTSIVIKNSYAKLVIGKNCMFAFNITLYHTDSHPIFDLDTNKIINKVGTLSIGEHVWVGANATILKNAFIADDSVVGWGSVVSGRFDTKNVVIAGNPAKVVKTNITWNSDGSKGYVQNEKD